MDVQQAQMVMLDMLVRTVLSEALKAIVWAAVFAPLFLLLRRD
jgi:hypothetical protein